ncbi:hypothetical protein JR065_04715 [Xanthomonas sp. AmX2]|uniref:hypothetical protein n=1 Tax=Xanthomonas sp. TaxID=29446 RepID=UPI001981689C|nr:hypothetical protein [Xanthomonas sp.]MBN6149633.1 hypothetical protein [Xanthomonas sp.]
MSPLSCTRTPHPWLLLALLCPSLASAADAPAAPGTGLKEIPDPELNLMRGRYTVGGDAVAWFGVSMVSQWQTGSGQVLHSALTLGMDFSRGGATPRLSFSPSVSITAADAPLPGGAAGATRSVDAAGLQNVSGLVQGVQIAGDGNRASNHAQLRVRDGAAPSADTGGAAASVGQQLGGAQALASYDGDAARVLLQVEGQGAVQQWIRNGSVGQSVQLSGDGQQVSNRLQIDLVRQSLGDTAPLTQHVAQAISFARGLGTGVGR